MKKYLKTASIVFILSIVLPNISFASWWNPFSWTWFNKGKTLKVEEIKISTSIKPVIQATSSAENDKNKNKVSNSLIKIEVEKQIKDIFNTKNEQVTQNNSVGVGINTSGNNLTEAQILQKNNPNVPIGMSSEKLGLLQFLSNLQTQLLQIKKEIQNNCPTGETDLIFGLIGQLTTGTSIVAEGNADIMLKIQSAEQGDYMLNKTKQCNYYTSQLNSILNEQNNINQQVLKLAY